MKIRVIGTKVLFKKVELKSPDYNSAIVLPESAKHQHPGIMLAGKVLSVGEAVEGISIGDTIILDAHLMVASFGQNENEIIVEKHYVLGVVAELEDWTEEDVVDDKATAGSIVVPINKNKK
jgi:co-chaperonin GroES (HSP10)